MAKIELRACDVCGRHEGQRGIEIVKVALEVGDERIRAEVCQDEAKPLRELIKKLPAVARRRGSRHDFSASMVDDPSQIPRDGNGPDRS